MPSADAIAGDQFLSFHALATGLPPAGEPNATPGGEFRALMIVASASAGRPGDAGFVTTTPAVARKSATPMPPVPIVEGPPPVQPPSSAAALDPAALDPAALGGPFVPPPWPGRASTETLQVEIQARPLATPDDAPDDAPAAPHRALALEPRHAASAAKARPAAATTPRADPDPAIGPAATIAPPAVPAVASPVASPVAPPPPVLPTVIVPTRKATAEPLSSMAALEASRPSHQATPMARTVTVAPATSMAPAPPAPLALPTPVLSPRGSADAGPVPDGATTNGEAMPKQALQAPMGGAPPLVIDARAVATSLVGADTPPPPPPARPAERSPSAMALPDGSPARPEAAAPDPAAPDPVAAGLAAPHPFRPTGSVVRHSLDATTSAQPGHAPAPTPIAATSSRSPPGVAAAPEPIATEYAAGSRAPGGEVAVVPAPSIRIGDGVAPPPAIRFAYALRPVAPTVRPLTVRVLVEPIMASPATTEISTREGLAAGSSEPGEALAGDAIARPEAVERTSDAPRPTMPPAALSVPPFVASAAPATPPESATRPLLPPTAEPVANGGPSRPKPPPVAPAVPSGATPRPV